MRIITVGREFGSGGREIGKRLSDILECDYYDKEIITEIAKKVEMDEHYVSEMSEKTLIQNFSITFGRTFSNYVPNNQNVTKILLAQQDILKEIAERGRDCIIVGRSADVILRKYFPFNMFVYADMESKIRRCIEREEGNKQFSTRQMEKEIKKVDAERAKYCELIGGSKWGSKEKYHLCVNTSSCNIKELTQSLAAYVNMWFEQK